MITLEGVTKHFGAVEAVRGVDATIREGEITVLIGPSGCGKSTLLRMINRMIEPSSGRICISGEDVRDTRPELLRRRIGYVIQNVGLFPHYTVYENVSVVPRLLGWKRPRIEGRVLELLDLMGLERSFAQKKPRELSGGEAQRVGVARALAANPPILLMDEPFGAVDPQNRARLQTEFDRIQKQLRKTVVFVTHDVEEAIRLADRIAVMRDGRLVGHSSPEDFIRQSSPPFISEFLGADYSLNLLARHRLGDHYQPLRGTTPDASNPALPGTASVKEAVALLVTRQLTELTVSDEAGDVLGTFTLDCIGDLFGGVPGGS